MRWCGSAVSSVCTFSMVGLRLDLNFSSRELASGLAMLIGCSTSGSFDGSTSIFLVCSDIIGISRVSVVHGTMPCIHASMIKGKTAWLNAGFR